MGVDCVEWDAECVDCSVDCVDTGDEFSGDVIDGDVACVD